MTDDPRDPYDDVRARFDAAEPVTPDPDLDGPDEDRGEGGEWEPDSAPPYDPSEGPPGDGPIADPDRLARACALPLNDFGNGQRMALHFGDDMLFVPRVGWFTWAGTHWAKDPDNLTVRRNAQRLASFILAEIPFLRLSDREQELITQEQVKRDRLLELESLHPDRREEGHAEEVARLRTDLKSIEGALKGHKTKVGRHVTHAKNAGNSGPLQHMLEEAQTLLARPLEALDAAPLDVNCLSGLLRFSVDVDRKGEVREPRFELVPHAREQLQSKCMAVAYDPDADCPGFDRFLAEVQPDPDMRSFLQRWFGLNMTGLPVQKLLFQHGSGANGKSVLADLMARMLGDYAASIRIESLTGTARRGGGDATPDLIPLIGARMARTSEPDQGTRLQEGLIKELTGGEPVLVRALHSDFVEIRPIFKLTMSGNHRPEIRGTDDGIWRRVMLVPWEVTIPEARRNPNLVEDLMQEAPGILNWMIRGLMAYLEFGLSPPDSVTSATEEYRQESDPLGQFLDWCCVMTGNPADTIFAEDLGHAFAFYMIERGETPWKPTTVARQLGSRSKSYRHPQSGWGFTKSKASRSQYSGLRLTDDFARRFRDAPKDHRGAPLRAAPDPVSEN
jgi:putative DNA primase/helicase